MDLDSMQWSEADGATWVVPHLVAGADGRAVFVERRVALGDRGGMWLSDAWAMGATMRLRESRPGYAVGWHVSAEPVLIVVVAGVLRIGLREGGRAFGAGELFVADDAPGDGAAFDASVHGHTAAVEGDGALRAVHVKLAAG